MGNNGWKRATIELNFTLDRRVDKRLGVYTRACTSLVVLRIYEWKETISESHDRNRRMNMFRFHSFD